MYRHRSVSLNNEKICCEITEDKIIAFCEKNCGSTEWELFGFELSMFESSRLVPVKVF